jgi:hypothetical protein
MKFKKNPILFLGVLLAGAMACNLAGSLLSPGTATPAAVVTAPAIPTTSAPAIETPPATAQPPSPTETPVSVSTDVYPPDFADYPVIPVNLPDSYSGGYSLPLDLGLVQGMDIVTLTDQQKSLLASNGFVVSAPEAGKYREFYQIYEQQRYALDQPIFATTDAVFHVYHLIFDKMLRDLEREHFIATLEKLTQTMLQASQSQFDELQGTTLEEPARRNLAYFAVAAQLLDMPEPVPAQVKDLVDAEVALITAHNGPAVSPIWDREDLPNDKKLIEDYSQYVPRGHYTRSAELQRYFKAMMWYGRLTFRARDAFETRRALLLVQALRSASTSDGTSATQLWQNIYESTVFIVGKADDLSYFEYGGLSDQIFGADASSQSFADDSKLEAFRQAVAKLPPPQVNSMWVWIWEDKQEATQGFRFMGQRFTLDQYVFGQMIWRNVGTSAEPRGLPKALDFFAAMGSEDALNILKDMGEDHYANYDTQMDKVRGEVSGLGLDSWTQNLYWSWLHALQPLIESKGSQYPAFMQYDAWRRKDLQTALGSWTELKHDTILYAKQVMAEMGGGGSEEPPHGYVEPNPEAYARLEALAEMTFNGLQGRGLLTDLTRGNLQNLMDVLKFMKDISERELSGQPISDEEYWRIQYFGGQLEALTLAASDCEDQDPAMCRDLSDQKAALVADVATGLDPNGDLAVLEEGIGQPTEIYVVLPDSPYRIGVGAVYTYYEFVVPPSERMTDEQWQAQVESGENPPQPDWTDLFIAP